MFVHLMLFRTLERMDLEAPWDAVELCLGTAAQKKAYVLSFAVYNSEKSSFPRTICK